MFYNVICLPFSVLQGFTQYFISEHTKIRAQAINRVTTRETVNPFMVLRHSSWNVKRGMCTHVWVPRKLLEVSKEVNKASTYASCKLSIRDIKKKFNVVKDHFSSS